MKESCHSCGINLLNHGPCLECVGCAECVIDVDTSRCLVCGDLDSPAEYERVCKLLTLALGGPRESIMGEPLWVKGRWVLTTCEEECELYVCSDLSAAIGIGKGSFGMFLPLDGSAETDAAIQRVIMCFKMRLRND